MSQSFIISATVFIIVMVIFHILKDIIIKGYSLTADQRSKINKRWLISTALGLFILFLLYSCNTEDENCQKGIANNNVACIKIYRPVKAPDGTIYSNSCIAEADGWDNNCLTLVDA